MTDTSHESNLKLRAYSPGKYPILVVELPEGELRLLYHETGYDLDRFKPAEESWLRDNAVGRHSFVEVDPPQDLSASELGDYVEREVSGI
jgi:hypothetical protein